MMGDLNTWSEGTVLSMHAKEPWRLLDFNNYSSFLKPRNGTKDSLLNFIGTEAKIWYIIYKPTREEKFNSPLKLKPLWASY